MATCDVNRAITDLEAQHLRATVRQRERRRLAGELVEQRRYVGALSAWASSAGGLGTAVVVAPALVGTVAAGALGSVSGGAALAAMFSSLSVTALLIAGESSPERIRAHHLVTWPVLAVTSVRRRSRAIEATLAPYRSVLPGRVVRSTTRSTLDMLLVIGVAMIGVGLLGLAAGMLLQAMMLPASTLVLAAATELGRVRREVAVAIDASLAAGCEQEAIAEAGVRSDTVHMFTTVLQRLREDA